MNNEEYDAEAGCYRPREMAELIRRMLQDTGGWPKRVNDTLFAVSPGGEVCLFRKAPQLFGWLAKYGTIYWSKAPGCVTKEEFFSELTRTTHRYEAIESLPHSPERKEVFYTRQWSKTGDGKAWSRFVEMFDPATEMDRDLITALFATALWGGGGGRRPAFIISSDDGPGSGKSTLARMVGYLFGGLLEFSKNEDIQVIKSRLLSPEALTKRVVLIDNVKDSRVNWADLECLVTSPVISGKRMYQGEGTRPNLITWIMTLNGIALSADLAQRSVVLKLSKKKFRAGFDEELYHYMDENRDAMIGDLTAILARPVAPLENLSRWGTWEQEVLARVTGDPGKLASEICTRQASSDDDAEEAELLRQEIREQLILAGHNPREQAIRIPVKIMTAWAAEVWKLRMPTQAMSRRIRQMMKHHALPELRDESSRTWGRCLIWEEGDPKKSPVNYLPWAATF